MGAFKLGIVDNHEHAQHDGHIFSCNALQDPTAEYEQLPREHELLSVVSQIVEAADRREDAAKILAGKVFTQMFEVTNSRFDCSQSILTSVCDLMP